METQEEHRERVARETQELRDRARQAGDKTYAYRKGKFLWDVVGQGLITVALAVFAVYGLVVGLVRPLMAVVLVVSVYSVWNTFVSGSYVHSVRLSDEVLAFECFGRTHAYRLDQVHHMRLREFPGTYKVYVRMDDEGLLHGRYWVRGWWMPDGDELFYRLVDLDDRLNPDSLKARARRAG